MDRNSLVTSLHVVEDHLSWPHRITVSSTNKRKPRVVPTYTTYVVSTACKVIRLTSSQTEFWGWYFTPPLGRGVPSDLGVGEQDQPRVEYRGRWQAR